ncbi:MAG: alanine--tRNA ligase [Rickettsiales bacterium]|nr:alanine--tRNA ligase [Rickettsiales bacterium]
MTTTSDIRSTFLSYFKKNGHEIRPSSSLVPHNDPTLMFANAGMNQFKNVFTGVEKLPYSRAASSQKVVRAGGKHNDLDNVGYTARHHTFFEMLGNFSFGDYFKEGAIPYAWELLTKEYGLNPDKLSFTVYHTDDQAFDLWKKVTGCADSRILRVPTNDNFWMMGDTGPCGPCSEIFYDHGEKAGEGEWALNPDGSDRFSGRFVEIWNLVFMQFNQQEGATRQPLPEPSIDTGMGLERISAVMQGVHDNYDIDLFKALIASIKDHAAQLGGAPAATAAPYKVIADHLRSSCFLIADGVMPSNEGRGYVLRRIMRRAMRYAHQLGCKDPLMHLLVTSLVQEMGQAYPELVRAQASIIDNLRQEEERFKETLGRGLKLLDEESAKLKTGQNLAGEAAFKLYDTYGFPLDLTQDILKSRGIGVDTDGFEQAMESQREMARAAWTGSGEKAVGKLWFDIKEKTGATEFLGYDSDYADSTIVAIAKAGEQVNAATAGDDVFIILDRTPFYGESGGQVGDTGDLFQGADKIASIADTQKPVDDFIVHKTKLLAAIKVGDKVRAVINANLRNATRANHSATHLLHKALRDKLGEHVTQKGSLVAPDRLRFDFSHTKAVSRDEIAAIEQKINEVIWRGGDVQCKEMAPDDAIKAGAMALFGEKYGDRVRVLTMGEDSGKSYSTELCGGTHVRAMSDIGVIKITSEGSVASGIRRIEAVTNEGVRSHAVKELDKYNEQLQKLIEENTALLAGLGKKPEQPVSLATADIVNKAPLKEIPAIFDRETARLSETINKLQDDNKKLQKTLAEARKQEVLANNEVTAEKIGNIQFIGKIFDGLDPKELRSICEQYLKKIEPGIVAVATVVEGKASLVVGVDKFLTDMYGAPHLVQAAVAELGGKGGGGRPEMAQGGGPDAEKLPAALDKIRVLIGGTAKAA